MLSVYFGLNQVEYLGHIFGGGVIAMDPSKMHAIMVWSEAMPIKHV